MGHSEYCLDITTFYDRDTGACKPCEKPGPGKEIAPNCGNDDLGGRMEPPHRNCPEGKFNDGNDYFCKPCESCGKQQTTTDSAKIQHPLSTRDLSETMRTSPSRIIPTESWLLPLMFICTMLLFLSCLFIYRKRVNRKSHGSDAPFTPLPAAQETTELKDLLHPDILAAPLKCVLDNRDVLEELIVLLDPETQGIKNTKHLASLCSFSSSWVTYRYSLKESRSPLNALLEKFICKHPESTVGSLAELLRQMERMDAVMALSKIRPNQFEIIDV